VQLELFHGAHLPLQRARAALEQGDLRGAHEALLEASAEQGVGEASKRLEMLAPLLIRHGSAEPSPDEVHAAFASAFEGSSRLTSDLLSAAEWFRLYAAHIAETLAGAPALWFRGWCRLHFELAAGRPRPALTTAGRLVSARAGRAWLEAARAAHAAGEISQGRRWILAACLASSEALDASPPQLTPVGRRELDAPDFALPRLPIALEDLWTDAVELALADPISAWVPSLGLIDGAFTLADLRSIDVAEACGFALGDPAPSSGEPQPRAFLRALVSAREARAHEAPSGGGCGALELRARAAMKRAAPALFGRYMERLGLGLV
jgi:hypothetical protein